MAAAIPVDFSEDELFMQIFGKTEVVANPAPDANLVDANLYSFQAQLPYELSVYPDPCSAIATTPDTPSQILPNVPLMRPNLDAFQGQVPYEYPDQYSAIALATPDIPSQISPDIPLMEPHLPGPNPPMGPNLHAKPYMGATYQAIQDQVHTTSTGQPSCGFKHYSPYDEGKTEDKRKNKKQRTEVKPKSKKSPSCITCYNAHKECVKKVKYKKCERCELKGLECDDDKSHRITRSRRKSPKIPAQLNENEGSRMLPEEPRNVINSLEAPSEESQNVVRSSEVLQASDELDDYNQLMKYIDSSLMKDIEDVVNEHGVALMALDENGMPVFDSVVLDLIYPNVNTSNRRESDVSDLSMQGIALAFITLLHTALGKAMAYLQPPAPSPSLAFRRMSIYGKSYLLCTRVSA